MPSLGKILEKVVHLQLHVHLLQSSLFDSYQSGFRVNHSTETALVRVVNDLKINSDKVSVLVSLISVQPWIRLTMLLCFSTLKTFLALKALFLIFFLLTLPPEPSLSLLVTLNWMKSAFSILGPLLFNLPIGFIILQYNMSYHSYADGTQTCLLPYHLSLVNDLIQFINDLRHWITQSFLQLNED